jgi:hypothetical protein
MHQTEVAASDESVIDEVVFFDFELGIASFEIARAVALHALA